MTDLTRLKKLLNLTTSPFDGEALNAIRKANEEIRKEDKTWDEVLEEKEGYDPTDKYVIERLKNDYAMKKEEIEELEIKVGDLEEDIIKERTKASFLEAQVERLKRACEFREYEKTGSTKRKTEYYEGTSSGYTDSYGRYVPKSKRR